MDGMREGKTRLSLERTDPATLEEALSIALREDFKVLRLTPSLRLSLLPDLLGQSLWRLM